MHQRLLDYRNKGSTVICITGDLNEALAISDRIAVIYEGKIRGIRPNFNVDINEIEKLILGLGGNA